MLPKLTLSLVALILSMPLVSAQSVDEIIAKNIQARGGMDKLKSVGSVRSSGKMTMGAGMEAPGTVIIKRPNFMRIEFTVEGLTAIQAFDGSKAWQIMPFTGKKDPELMSDDEKKDLEDNADIDGPLVDYKAKGNQVELIGKDKVEGAAAYKLKVTLHTGDVQTIYLDADSFLEIKEEIKRTVRGSEQDFESSIGDYKEVNGIMFPFAVESSMKGSDQKQKLTIEKVELNVPVEDAQFKMPAAAPTPKPEAAKPEAAKPDTPKN